MQDKNKIYEIINDLKKKIPSYYVIPVGNDKEARAMDEKNIIGAIVLQNGKFKDHTIIFRNIEMKDSEIIIDYTAVDKDKKNVESKELDEIVGNLVNYFLANSCLFDNDQDNH